MSDSAVFRRLLETDNTLGLDPGQIERAIQFREEVLKENEIQNLTRLLSPQDFLDGHLRDVVHLNRSNLVTYPAMDLGAGMGVPGLFSAILYGTEGGKEWISCDSEVSKAGFSQRMIDLFGLDGVSSEGIRAEEVLDNQEVGSIVARAVGPVSRIYGWVRTRSTWNNLVLLKGPKWSDEWSEFTSSPQKNKLKLSAEYKYAVGQEEKQRIIVKLSRK